MELFYIDRIIIAWLLTVVPLCGLCIPQTSTGLWCDIRVFGDVREPGIVRRTTRSPPDLIGLLAITVHDKSGKGKMSISLQTE